MTIHVRVPSAVARVLKMEASEAGISFSQAVRVLIGRGLVCLIGDRAKWASDPNLAATKRLREMTRLRRAHWALAWLGPTGLRLARRQA